MFNGILYLNLFSKLKKLIHLKVIKLKVKIYLIVYLILRLKLQNGLSMKLSNLKKSFDLCFYILCWWLTIKSKKATTKSKFYSQIWKIIQIYDDSNVFQLLKYWTNSCSKKLTKNQFSSFFYHPSQSNQLKLHYPINNSVN